MKKYIVLLGVVILMSLAGCKKNDNLINERETGDKVEQINFDKHTLVHKKEELKLGFFENITFTSDLKLSLDANSSQGTYTSPIINSKAFYELVASWNALTPNDTSIELLVQVRQNNVWSKWFSYGIWTTDRVNYSQSKQEDNIAKMNIDTIILKNNLTADGFKYMIKLNRDDVKTESPKVSLVALTMYIADNYVETVDLTNLNYYNDIEVPINSQMIVPVIGNVICSPTSLTMLLRHYNINVTPKDTAAKVKDQTANIYGNWSFNVAYAGSLGIDAYVSRLTTIAELKQLIALNKPVAVSITVKDLSQLDGAPMAYPSGHLLVVRGFTIIDGIEFVIVNDPAAPNDNSVYRQYKLEQFEKIWKNYVYILEL